MKPFFTNIESCSAIDGGDKEGEEEEDSEVEIVLLFATTEFGLKMQDAFPRTPPYGALIGLSVPHIFFRGASNLSPEGEDEREEIKKKEEEEEGDAFLRVFSHTMRDFIGFNEEANSNDALRTALLDFSFYLTLGKLDEAYKAVRLIDSPAIWENMAHMCVKTKRLDVAEISLGNMGHARGAAALRESRKENGNNLEASVGILAVQLGTFFTLPYSQSSLLPRASFSYLCPLSSSLLCAP